MSTVTHQRQRGFHVFTALCPLILPPRAEVAASRLTAVFMNLARLIADMKEGNIAHLAGVLVAIGPQRPSLLPAVNVPSESGTVLGLIAVKEKVDLFPVFHQERH